MFSSSSLSTTGGGPSCFSFSSPSLAFPGAIILRSFCVSRGKSSKRIPWRTGPFYSRGSEITLLLRFLYSRDDLKYCFFSVASASQECLERVKATRYAAAAALKVDWETKSPADLAEKWERSRFHLVIFLITKNIIAWKSSFGLSLDLILYSFPTLDNFVRLLLRSNLK